MYKFIALIASAAAINMVKDAKSPVPQPACVPNEGSAGCHFQGLGSSCSCPVDSRAKTGKCVKLSGKTGSNACYIEESLTKKGGPREPCSCPAEESVEEKKKQADVPLEDKNEKTKE